MPRAPIRRKTKRRAARPAARYEYTVVFQPAEEGGYVVTVPALPGLHTEGGTIEEARAMAADAIRCYLEGCMQDGEEIPVERDGVLHSRIAVSLSA